MLSVGKSCDVKRRHRGAGIGLENYFTKLRLGGGPRSYIASFAHPIAALSSIDDTRVDDGTEVNRLGRYNTRPAAASADAVSLPMTTTLMMMIFYPPGRHRVGAHRNVGP